MPLGLKNSPKTPQMLMNSVFHEFLGMYSGHHLVSCLSMMLLIIFHCTLKVCILQNSGSSV